MIRIQQPAASIPKSCSTIKIFGSTTSILPRSVINMATRQMSKAEPKVVVVERRYRPKFLLRMFMAGTVLYLIVEMGFKKEHEVSTAFISCSLLIEDILFLN